MSVWKPTAPEAQFLGEVLCIDAGLASMVKEMLEKGQSLNSVRDALKQSLAIASTLRKGA